MPTCRASKAFGHPTVVTLRILHSVLLLDKLILLAPLRCMRQIVSRALGCLQGPRDATVATGSSKAGRPHVLTGNPTLTVDPT